MYTCIYVYSYGHHLAAQVIGKRERHSLPMFELGYKSRRRASEVDKIVNSQANSNISIAFPP